MLKDNVHVSYVIEKNPLSCLVKRVSYDRLHGTLTLTMRNAGRFVTQTYNNVPYLVFHQWQIGGFKDYFYLTKIEGKYGKLLVVD